MNKELKALCEDLTNDIKTTYDSGTTLDQAEKLAAKFLYGQIKVAEELQVFDLDSRMKKSAVKAIKGAVYLEAATKGDKKPTEATLQALVDRSELVTGEQTAFDEAESEKQALENYLNIFREAHVYFRGISRGRFE